MVPAELRARNSATFNFSVFAPGNNCSPSVYRLRIWPAADGSESNAEALQSIGSSGTILTSASSSSGPKAAALSEKASSNLNSVTPLHFNLTLTKRDLFSLDSKSWNRRCCYNLSGLNPGSYYQYHVVAENPAGKTPHFGYFWTRTVGGIQPREGASTRLGRASFLAQPTIIVPLTIFLVVLFVAFVCLVFYLRHRRLEAELNPSATNKPIVGRPIQVGHPPHIQQMQQQLSAYTPGGAAGAPMPGRIRATLPPIPVNEEKPPEYREKTGFLGRWVRGSRLYDRGRAGTIVPPVAPPSATVEPDRLSTSSMDSTGNLNPYATYAAGGIEEGVTEPVASKSSTTLPSSRIAARTLDVPVGSSATGGVTRVYKTFNKGVFMKRFDGLPKSVHK